MKSTLIVASLLTAALGAPTNSHMSMHKRQNNLQTFTGALGGIAATPVENSGDAKRPFQVKGDTFVNIGAALQRSCDQQFNACANAANGGDATLSVSACNDQKTQCDAAAQSGASNANSNASGSANATASQNSNANSNASQSAKSNCNSNKNSNSNASGAANSDKNKGSAAAAAAADNNNSTQAATGNGNGKAKGCNNNKKRAMPVMLAEQ